ncbi:hypothetical protein MMC09_003143 [Bachmanniomyces sp. S44760]|nr:hypothetical protein [Bachmanniomyces sp. S44760]
MSNEDDTSTVPKLEQVDEASFSSIGSSPEPEVDVDVDVDGDGEPTLLDNAKVQKRKGGRKPIYATSEERKQRNRQAQAAFRERRTEYIKQLETTIRHQEETVQKLQQSHRSAADECLMLRYKNSLLERILLEKGIDVQAELKTKENAAQSGPSKGSSQPTNPSSVQRAIMNRHHQARRSVSANTPKLLSALSASSHPSSSSTHSPQLQPTPPSTLSPTVSRSPNYVFQGGMTSPGAGLQAQQQQQQQHPQHPSQLPPRVGTYPNSRGYPNIAISTSHPNMPHPAQSPAAGQFSGERSSAGGTKINHWPSPYQTHIEQLGKLAPPLPFQREYDHADVLDDQDQSDQSAGPGPYPQPFHQPYPPGQHPQLNLPGQSTMQPPMTLQPGEQPPQPYGQLMNQTYDAFDPSVDADPFGLTASMHFPTQFTFQESSMRK